MIVKEIDRIVHEGIEEDIVIMKTGVYKFIEFQKIGVSVFFEILSDENLDEGTIMMDKTLMDDLSLSDGDEIAYTLHKKLNNNRNNIRIDFLKYPRYSKDIINHDINVTFKRRFRKRPINIGITYHFKCDDRDYKVKVTSEKQGYVMPVKSIFFDHKDKEEKEIELQHDQYHQKPSFTTFAKFPQLKRVKSFEMNKDKIYTFENLVKLVRERNERRGYTSPNFHQLV